MKILDCTLRDGGYYNDWNFSSDLSKKYIQSISKLPIDIIEVGYVSNNKNDNFGLHYHLNVPYLKDIKKKLRKNQKLCCMVNAKEIKSSKDLIKLLLPYEGVVDLVRFAIDPKKIDFFLNLIFKTKKKIKKISFMINLMYLSEWYSNVNYVNSLINKTKKVVNNISLVDSHGSLKPHEAYSTVKKIIKSNKDIILGCHFHNNCGLALANSLSAIDAGCEIVDATIKGMGRGAGNTETELLLSILRTDRINFSSFLLDELLEKFQDLKNELQWGSSFIYSLSAAKGYSQSEIMDLLFKKRLDANMALTSITSKLKNNKNIKFKNINALNKLKKRTPLLIGGAPSFKAQGKSFLSNLKSSVPIILSGSNAFKNYLKINLKVKNTVILITTGNEINKIKEIKNNSFMKKAKINYLVVEKDFYGKKLNNIDKKRIIVSESFALNPLLLTGKMLAFLKIKKLNLAFFDGDYSSQKSRNVLKETEQSLNLISKHIDIKTFTKSFLKVDQINLWNNDQFLHTN
jgi:4-hydroxy 2-oxovalerate aldolase